MDDPRDREIANWRRLLFLVAVDRHTAAHEETGRKHKAWLDRRGDRIAQRLRDGVPEGWEPPIEQHMTPTSVGGDARIELV